VKKAEEVPEEDNQLISKLREQNYEQFTGTIMDKLWMNCADDP